MATFENSCNGNYGSGYRIRLEVTENSTNVTNNSSNVTVVVKAYAINNSYGNYGYYNPTYIYIDGAQKAYNNPSTDYRNQRVNTLCSWTGDITHDSLGNKTINVSASFSSSSSNLSGGSVNGTVQLSYIPRKSTISAITTDIGSNTTITINRASSSFTHTITYSFGSLSGTIATKTSNTNISWEIPTSFYAQIPNSKTGTCTLTCTTFSGDTNIGSNTGTFTIIANEILCKPDVTGAVQDINATTISLTGDSSKLVKYKSIAQITTSSTAKNSATINNIKINGVVGSNRVIEDIETNVFEIIATDSRGYSTTINITIPMVNYVVLTATSNFKRVSNTSNTVNLICSGNYFDGDFGSELNTLSLTYKYREKGSSSWIDGTTTITPTITNNTYSKTIQLGESFDYRKNWEFSLYYEDELVNDNTGINNVTKGLGDFEIYKNAIVSNGIRIDYSFSTSEIAVGTWIDNRTIYRKVINFGNLPNSTTKSVAHLVANLKEVTKIYGIWDNGLSYWFTLPFNDNVDINDAIKVYASDTNVYVETSTDYSYATAFIVMEYTKTTD